MYCAIKKCMGGAGALIETIFYCSSAASGWKRGKCVLNHMGSYNGTRLKTAMSNSIPALVPTGHSSLTEPSALRIWFSCALSSSKCSQNARLCRKSCNCSRDEVALGTNAIKVGWKLHLTCSVIEYIASGWGIAFGERYCKCRWSLHWRDAKCRKKFKGGRNSILLKRWGMMECSTKRGQNCNNSCRLLRNTECFPAIWINKHSLDPLRPRLSFSPNGFVGVPSAALSNPTCFQLTVMKEEITASLRFLALWTTAWDPKLWFCFSPHAICVFQWIQINRCYIGSAFVLRSPWGD